VNNMKKIIILLILIGIICYVGKGVFTKNTWDLMVCKILMDDGAQCYDNSYVLKGYKTQNECMEKGIELAKKEGFECGKNCKKEDGMNLIVCDVICNKNGCH